MILLLGDIHGNHSRLRYAIHKAVQTDATAIIQVGDFGLFGNGDSAAGFYNICKESPIPVYFIEGNHDDCVRWVQYEEVSRVWPDANLWYVPRGTVMELDGRTIAFMGGAASIDKDYRLRQNMHWDENENITPAQIARLLKNAEGKQIDLFITHCPPNSVIEEHFDNSNKLYFGVGLDWTDPNQQIIEDLWHKLGTPMVYSGHMHRRVGGVSYRILDIDELVGV
jgi:UDP-2,3-diacylglucosamine pyrophosphatase LpxH